MRNVIEIVRARGGAKGDTGDSTHLIEWFKLHSGCRPTRESSNSTRLRSAVDHRAL